MALTFNYKITEMIRYFFFSLVLSLSQLLSAQDFILQDWYWNYPQVENRMRWAEYLSTRADEVADAGFTYVWLMPLSQGSGGGYSVGYDVQDYYNLGDKGLNRYGQRRHLDFLLDSLKARGLKTIADVVYNHRDGGRAEVNPALRDYMYQLSYAGVGNGDNAYPSDRYRLALPLGGSTDNFSGDYYFKVRSKTMHPRYFGKEYYFEAWTNKKGKSNEPLLQEAEPNGGGDCGQPFNIMAVQRVIKGSVDAGGCGIDEYKITLDTSDFYATGDTLWMTLQTANAAGYGDHADLYFHGIWAAEQSRDISDQVLYQTFTDFSKVWSGKGIMNWKDFKPNGNPTGLSGDWDGMWFYYDIDQYAPNARKVLFEFTDWLWTDIGIRGLRLDAVKHFDPAFVGDLLDYMHDKGHDPGIVVGEYYDGNGALLKGWVDAVKAAMDADTRQAIEPRVFDFSLRYSLKEACDAFGYDVRNVFHSSLADAYGASGFETVTFVGNHDFRSKEQKVQNDPILAYAYILSNNQLGIPCVYYPDYFKRPDDAGKIKGLMEAHKKYIYGASARYYLNNYSSPYSSNFISGYPNTSLIYQLSGSASGREVVVAINFSGETLKVDQSVEMAALSEGDTMTDIFGFSAYPYALVKNGQMYMELPPRSFSVWVQGDLQQHLIPTDPPFQSTGMEAQAHEQTWDLNISLYPNPATDYTVLGFRQKKAEALSYVLYAPDGRVLRQGNILAAIEGQIKIPVSGLPTGIYQILLRSANRMRSASLIIAH